MIDKVGRVEQEPLVEDARDAASFVSELIKGLGDEDSFDAHSVLAEHPSLRRFKSAVLDLALEQYCRAVDAGDRIDPSEFAQTFPDYHHSLRCLLEVQDALQPALKAEEKQELNVSVGDEFLGFQLHELLGRGAFSRVFLATEPGVGGRTVVLKVCRYGEYEVQAIAALQHESIVPVFYVRRDPETNLTAICMPFLSRTTLHDVMDQIHGHGRLPTDGRSIVEVLQERNNLPTVGLETTDDFEKPSRSAKSLARQSYIDVVIGFGVPLAEALAHTHARGIYHGDIKPSNVLVTRDGKPLLFDFNLSFTRDDTARIGGTLPYMSPEHLQAMVEGSDLENRLGAQSDVFSFGVMLYELLCGALPFGEPPVGQPRDEIVPQLLARQQSGPRPIQKLNPKIDGKLAAVIEHCLEFRPEKRLSSAAWLEEKLREVQSRRLARWVRANRRQALLIGLGGAGALLGGGAALISYLTRPVLTDDEIAIQQGMEAFRRGDYPLAIEHLRSVRGESLTDETHLALGRSYMKGGQFRLAIDHFLKVQAHASDHGPINACMGTCMAQLADEFGDPREFAGAYTFLQRARSNGFNNSAVTNNTAYCKMAERNRNVQAMAKPTLESMAARGDAIPQVYLNLAVLDMYELSQPPRPPKLHLIETALNELPGNRKVHAFAAFLYMIAAKRGAPAETQKRYEQALDQMEAAMKLGASKEFFSSKIYLPLKDDPRFVSLLEQAPETCDWQPLANLADPLMGDDSLLFDPAPQQAKAAQNLVNFPAQPAPLDGDG